MGKFKLLIVIICFNLITLATSEECDLQKYKHVIAKSNCSIEDFLPLCNSPRECRHFSLQLLSAGYYQAEGKRHISCTFPRMLAGEEGFIECVNFTTHYSCSSNSSIFKPRSTVCDDQPCNDCDESQVSHGAGPGFKCQSNERHCVLPQVLLYDNVADCENGEDLCFSGSYFNLNDNCAKCYDGSIIPKNALCDGIVDCSDLSDECNCQNSLFICDQVIPIFSSAPQRCKPGQISCGNGNCIERSQVCDGRVDCNNQIDERSEYCGASLLCRELTISNTTQECRCYEAECRSSDQLANDYGVIRLSKENLTESICPITSRVTGTSIHEPAHCTFDDLLMNNVTFDAFKCDGIVQCEKSAIDENHCPGRHVCEGFDDSLISISERRVCNFVVDCADGSDELNCNDQRFYCRSDNLSFVRFSQVRNGRIDCEDGSDECFEESNATNTYFFHSKDHLIGNQVLYLLVWVMSFLALVGNTVVIIRQAVKLMKLRRRIDDLSSLRANHILVLNLAVADLLMGVYLLAVGINYERLKGSYCKQELQWRGSTVCTWMGITALISFEASVLTLVLLTSCRFYAVLQPFKTSSKPKTWLVLLLALFIWVVSSVIASIPLTDTFRSHVPDTVILSNNPFLSEPQLNLTTGKKFLLQSLVYYPTQDPDLLRNIAEQIQNSNTWDSLLEIYDSLPDQQQELQIAERYGYYNVHSICLADFFPAADNPYVALSLSIITFNLLAFLYIAAVYITIYSISFKNKPSYNEHCDSVNMQRKIFRIIVFNFISWIPICVLSLVRLNDAGGDMVTGDVYQVAAIVLLPINSAINPILYSDIVSLLFRKMCGYADDFKKRTIRLTSMDTNLSTGKSLTGSLKTIYSQHNQ